MITALHFRIYELQYLGNKPTHKQNKRTSTSDVLLLMVPDHIRFSYLCLSKQWDT